MAVWRGAWSSDPPDLAVVVGVGLADHLCASEKMWVGVSEGHAEHTIASACQVLTSNLCVRQLLA